MTRPQVNVTVDSPGELAALIAQLHREPPDGKLLAAGFTRGGTATATVHLTLADPPDPHVLVRAVTRLAGQLADPLFAGTFTVALAAFGPAHLADPYLDLAEGIIPTVGGLPVLAVLRVHAGRVWQYDVPAPEYGRGSEGEEYDPLSDHSIEAATAIAAAELGGQ